MSPGRSRLFVIEGNDIRIETEKKRVNPNRYKAKTAFVENWNLHKTPQQARGMLLAIFYNGRWRIGVVVKSFSSQLVTVLLLSKLNEWLAFNDITENWKESFDIVVVNPLETMGRFLQQVSGEPFKLKKERKHQYPFLGEDGCFSTAPIFEDIYDVPSLGSLPKIQINLCRSNHLSWKHPIPRSEREAVRKDKSNVDVLYVRESSGLRASFGSGCFGIVVDTVAVEDR